jgi:hypothetical protein
MERMTTFNYESLALTNAMPQLTDTQTQIPFLGDEGSFPGQSIRNLRCTKQELFPTDQINLSNCSIKTKGGHVS